MGDIFSKKDKRIRTKIIDNIDKDEKFNYFPPICRLILRMTVFIMSQKLMFYLMTGIQTV